MKHLELRFEEGTDNLSWVDQKGTWTMGVVVRTKYHEDRDHLYSLEMRFLANPIRCPKADRHQVTSRLTLYRSFEPSLKRAIKGAFGYTPDVRVLRDIWKNFNFHCDQILNEDAAYQNACKEPARATLEQLQLLAVERFKQGERQPQKGRALDLYLTKAELKEATEAQKILNGHAHVEYDSFGSGHLHKFNRRVEAEIDQIQKARELQVREDREQRLMALLDVDVDFRRLVAHALAAANEVRAGALGVELANRLFGYARSLADMQATFPVLKTLMGKYSLDAYEGSYLLYLGQKYLDAGGMLPVVQPEHQREEGRFYYDDWIHIGVEVAQVTRVGTRYVYTNKGRYEKRKARHFEQVTFIPSPDNLATAVMNERLHLHRCRLIPDAHRKPFWEIIDQLMRKKNWSFNPSRLYERRISKASGVVKEAMQLFLDGLRLGELRKSASHLELLHAVSPQQDLEPIRTEIRELEQRLVDVHSVF